MRSRRNRRARVKKTQRQRGGSSACKYSAFVGGKNVGKSLEDVIKIADDIDPEVLTKHVNSLWLHPTCKNDKPAILNLIYNRRLDGLLDLIKIELGSFIPS